MGKKNRLLGNIRARYQKKRKSKKWKHRKLSKVREKKRKASYERLLRRYEKIRRDQARKEYYLQRSKTPIALKAPADFSLINNTDEILEYWENVGSELQKKENVFVDIDHIESLTSDAVALMIAYINNSDFMNDSIIVGRAPRKRNLAKIFTQSGFYKYVFSQGKFDISNGEILHKETNNKVVPEIAVSSFLVGAEHTFGKDIPFDGLYEILIECMSNTHNHASLNRKDKCKWWIYTHPDDHKVTCYSFLDLGVGIFESMRTKGFFTKVLKTVGIYKNIDFVTDLLDGKIQSRMEKDRKIRGKGIPEIVKHSKNDLFRTFILITNDVKIDLKTGECQQLGHNFSGTFFYWEIKPHT